MELNFSEEKSQQKVTKFVSLLNWLFAGHLVFLVVLSGSDIDVLEGSFHDIWPNLVSLILRSAWGGVAGWIIQAY